MAEFERHARGGERAGAVPPLSVLAGASNGEGQSSAVSEVERFRLALSASAMTAFMMDRDLRKDGHVVCVSISNSPIHDHDGRVVGIARIARDCTERQAAAAEQARLAAIVESSPDAIVSVNTDGLIETWNKGAERIYVKAGRELTP